MKISKELPPIYDRAVALWGVDFHKGVVFTYGDTCHAAEGVLPEWLIPHEETHVRQQGDKPKEWWDRYFVDEKFRLEQELEAYRVQYQWILKHYKNPQKRFSFLKKFAEDLSGPIYGRIINVFEAMKQIRQ